MFGKYWFVDNTNAGAIHNGKAPETAFLTITAGVAKAADGDTVYVKGTGTDYDESVIVSRDNISLIAVSPHVKNCGWTADTDTTCLQVTGAGCVVDGFYFRPDGATSGIAIDIGTNTTTAQGNNTTIQNNLFKSTGTTCAYAIKANGCPEYVKLYNNHFTWVGYVVYADATPLKPATAWEIIGNYISDKCTYGIYLPARRCLIARNYINAASAPVLSLLGYGSSGTFNSVASNQFGGNYSNTGGYIIGTSDEWTGNFAFDYGETKVVDPSGATSMVPA